MLFTHFFNTQTTDLDEVVFTQRHRAYGAYELRHQYPDRIKKAYFITIVFMVVPIFLFIVLNRYTLPVFKQMPSNFGNTKPATYIIPKPSMPPKKITKAAGMPALSKIWKISKDSNLNESKIPNKIDNISTILTASNTGTGLSSGINHNTAVTSNPLTLGGGADRGPTRMPESMPVFPGGDDALMKYFSNNIKYSEIDLSYNIEGTVYVEFTVMPDGTITDVATLKDIGGTFTEQIIRAVKNMPHWQPGKNGTQIVSVRMTLPVRCSLHN